MDPRRVAEDKLDGLVEQYRAMLRGEAPPLTLYVHVPFCQDRCLYCGCNVVIAPQDKVSEPYVEVLEKEIALHTKELGRRRRVSQLHLGGGTPTYLSPAQLERLVGWLTNEFEFQPEAEISIEVDPVVTTEEHVRTLRRIGFNRISMGVQDLCPRVQEAVKRVQPVQFTHDFYSLCRDVGFESVNMDLIYGLPYQTVERFGETVEQIVRWGPDRVAVVVPDRPGLPGHRHPRDERGAAVVVRAGRGCRDHPDIDLVSRRSSCPLTNRV